MDIRPRTLGEILDDAWRLALADAPLLLLFNALFLVPAFLVLLLLLAQPRPFGMAQYLLPTLAALLLPLTGLASGTCQDLLRRRMMGETVIVRVCVTASLRNGLVHTAARAVLLCLTLPGFLLLMVSFLPDSSPMLRFLGFLLGAVLTFLFSLPLWGACTSLHALVGAAPNRSTTLLNELRRHAVAAPGKAAVVVLSRLSLLFFLAVQLHLLAKVILWIADNLGGWDMALIDVQLSFFDNAVYTTALFLLSWLLLAPFFECGNFLLHADVRTRQEGLDLQYRVQRAFAAPVRVTQDETNRQDAKDAKKERQGATKSKNNLSFLYHLLGVLGVLAVSLQPAEMARAEEAERQTIRAVRQEIETIRAEVEKAEPYPGGRRWQGRLNALQTKLTRIGDGEQRRFRWFEQAVDDFGDRKKEDALRILDDLHRRLSLLEDSLPAADQPEAQAREKRSPEDIKSLLRGSEGRKIERSQRRQRIEEDRGEVRREEEGGKGDDGKAPRAGGGRGTSVSVPAASGGGLSHLGWLLLGGVALAVVVMGVIFYLNSPRSPRTLKPENIAGTDKAAADNDARQVLEESPAALWRQADVMAEEGRFRDAMRLLYLAVLALLHRQRLIRFEPTRTNGEYVRQVCLSEQAPPQLHERFERLTGLFETAWYGERSCASGDYVACHALAETVQRIAQNGT